MALETIGEVTASSVGTTVTAGASADTYGSYSELVASTGQTCNIITVSIANNTASATRSTIIALATGAALSEVDFCEILFPVGGIQYGDSLCIMIPFTIASGTRIAARAKSSVGSTALLVDAVISDDSSWGTGSACELIGQSSSTGTAIDPGGSANTKGSWTQISASTSHDYDLIFVLVGKNNNAVTSAATWLIDIGTGAAASETVLVGDIQRAVSILEAPLFVFPIYAPISSGTRVAARAQCSITDATDRVLDLAILGVNLTAPSGGAAQTCVGYFG